MYAATIEQRDSPIIPWCLPTEYTSYGMVNVLRALSQHALHPRFNQRTGDGNIILKLQLSAHALP